MSNHNIKNFQQAKSIVYKMFQKHPMTLYCGCQYIKKMINFTSCSMHPETNLKRAERVEIEHMVPAQKFTKAFGCESRTECRKDSNYAKVEAELYNLWPAVGSVNGARGSKAYRDFPEEPNKEKYSFEGCPIIIRSEPQGVEPSRDAKGIVARASLFMHSKHEIPFTHQEMEMYHSWDSAYPPLSWEHEWNSHISHITGYDNPYISRWLEKLEL